MSSALARAHITAQERLRELTLRGVALAWSALPSYDERDVPGWLARVVPLVLGSQRQSVALTEAFLARSVGRQPLGVDASQIIAEQVRPGVAPDEEYRRPFVTVWTALSAGRAYDHAVHAGLARAVSMAATDVQLAMRETLRTVGDADERIAGYERVANGGACELCLGAEGTRMRTATPMPLHAGCGCGVDVLTEPFTPESEPDDVAVHEHGELGPMLADPAHDFTVL